LIALDEIHKYEHWQTERSKRVVQEDLLTLEEVVDVKAGEKSLSPNIPYFSERTDIPFFYQVHLGERNVENTEKRYHILPFLSFCDKIGIP